MGRISREAVWDRVSLLSRAWLLGWAVLGAAGADAGQAEEFRQALQACERKHWAEAYAGFAALADQGHAPSARQALLMVRFGPRLYAHRFEATAQRRQQWLQVATAENGSATLLAARPQPAP